MEIIKKLRLKFALNAMIIAAIFLLVMFGAVYGLLWSNDITTENRMLDSAINRPDDMSGGMPVKEDLVYTFVTNTGDNTIYMVNLDSFSEQYGDDAAYIVTKAINKGNGNFSYGDRHFAVKSVATSTGMKYVLHDRTTRHEQLILVLIETIVLYCAAVLLIFFIAYLFSAKTLKPVAETYAKQRDLIANASHELKTPLTVISTNLAVVKSEPELTVQDNEKWLASIDKQIERMQGLIQNMLELSKLEQSELPKVTINLSEIADGACLEFEAVCFEKGVKLVSEIQPDLRVLGERTSLERLVVILLDNAIKYSGENGKVGIGLAQDGKKIVLTVMNTGAVISEEDAKHVFDRFYRSDGARQNDDGKSFGLGLSIAAATVQAHGGTIECKGVENKGTVFRVYLPVAKKTA
ncbi:MAG: HAMP domain-containing histidine kinase [Clostridia bacterium]|nr:HAMP domain-containing histidine kinase [Clostridia bacterium]